jgi:spore germination cell wall hydrolase CwlJ-like protein
MRVYLNTFLIIIAMVCITIFATSTPQETKLFDVKYKELTAEARKQVDCLADNIYYEAGYEPDDGKLAVALVTINRTQDPRFPKDICSVVKQKVNLLCQFSWFCEGIKTKKYDVYAKSKEIAIFTYVNYEMLDDITNGALYFHADSINPNWKLKKTKVIGRHIFYKEGRNI